MTDRQAFCLAMLLLSMEFGNWVCFQYVLSFALQKLALPMLCFQHVLSFVSFVAFAHLRDTKSP
jgi:hypothetical protein